MEPLTADPTARRVRWAAALIALVGAGALIYLLMSRKPPMVMPSALATSVESHAGSPGLFPARCARTEGSSWSCTVSDAGSGGGATYTVHVSSDACWDARLSERDPDPEAPTMPATVSGCLH
jgi:hypothetical protein